jgi:SAM-dependent methyltransferase
VEFYILLPPGDEPGIVHAAAPSTRASVLELGAGTGRIAQALAELGHPVAAVDESPEMLARIQRAETVCARIQGLVLRRQFDVVLLASFLINTPDEHDCGAFLKTCARHVSDNGCVIIQQHPPSWFDSVTETEHESGGITFRLKNLSRPAPGLLSAIAEYQLGHRIWTHSFTTARLDEPTLQAALISAGLTLERYLTDDRQWLRAVPAACPKGGQLRSVAVNQGHMNRHRTCDRPSNGPGR